MREEEKGLNFSKSHLNIKNQKEVMEPMEKALILEVGSSHES